MFGSTDLQTFMIDYPDRTGYLIFINTGLVNAVIFIHFIYPLIQLQYIYTPVKIYVTEIFMSFWNKQICGNYFY